MKMVQSSKSGFKTQHKGNGVTNHHSTIYRAMKYEETFKQQMAVIEAMVGKTKKMKEENCDLYALIYMRGWLKGVVDDLDRIIP